MSKFEFSKASEGPELFIGREFYNEYKLAEFLKRSDNINRILNQGYELRHSFKTKADGEFVEFKDMWLTTNMPLFVKKTGKDIPVKHLEITQNRLTGLVAAYAYDNRDKLPNLQSEEAKALQLTWDNTDTEKCKLYLSAVTGTEHFDDQFSYWPLVCALKKLQLKKINEEYVVKIAKKKNNNGIRLSTVLKTNFEEAARIWGQLPGDSNFEEFVKTISVRFNITG